MGITRIKSHTASTFIQPNLGGTVVVVSDPGIDWISVGALVQIQTGGIYKIESITGFTMELRLETAIALPGQVVTTDIIFPVTPPGESASTTWGGTNGKEW